jgi:hypothetical protein
MYVGGEFGANLADGVSARLSAWSGSSWSPMSGLTGNVYYLAVAPDGSVYLIGQDSGYIHRWNGTRYSGLSGTDLAGATVIQQVAVGPDGTVYACGDFASADGNTNIAKFAQYNGSAWAPLDVATPGNTTGYSILAPWTGPLAGQLLIGFNTTGTAYWSGQTTVTNVGDRTAYPKIKIKRSGGTTARVQYIKNETTGDTLYLDYSLLDGETLTIDLDYQRDPTKQTPKTSGHKRITSDYFGDVIGRALVAGSDLAAFSLAPGANTISLYVAETGAPTVTAWLEYREPYWTPDGAI